uniref:Uncharacterized protein n=1 Tax=Rhizophora mucronata TaxID=61149 RepID=A0A2P2QYW7_RHIMU
MPWVLISKALTDWLRTSIWCLEGCCWWEGVSMKEDSFAKKKINGVFPRQISPTFGSEKEQNRKPDLIKEK